jgi:hypothetical protein
MAATFKLKANPTFRMKVAIPVAGGASVELDAEFRHFTRSQLQAFSSADATTSRSDVDTLAEIMSGWHNVDEPMTREALDVLVENYAGAAAAIVTTWLRELAAQRLGN